jgi:hypothetical protein
MYVNDGLGKTWNITVVDDLINIEINLFSTGVNVVEYFAGIIHISSILKQNYQENIWLFNWDEFRRRRNLEY